MADVRPPLPSSSCRYAATCALGHLFATRHDGGGWQRERAPFLVVLNALHWYAVCLTDHAVTGSSFGVGSPTLPAGVTRVRLRGLNSSNDGGGGGDEDADGADGGGGAAARSSRRVPDHVLTECAAVEAATVDLRGVCEIGKGFLFTCAQLARIDLRSAEGVTKLGDMFLCRCTALESVDLSGVTSLSHVGHAFLFGCTSLRSVALPNEAAITHIGNFFLAGCTSLSALDATGLRRTRSIGTGFLKDCTALVALDHGFLRGGAAIGTDFMLNCPAAVAHTDVDDDMTPGGSDVSCLAADA